MVYSIRLPIVDDHSRHIFDLTIDFIKGYRFINKQFIIDSPLYWEVRLWVLHIFSHTRSSNHQHLIYQGFDPFELKGNNGLGPKN